MLFPMKILVIFSIFGGSFLSWLIFPFFDLILLTYFLKFLTLFVCFLGILFGYFLFNLKNIFFLKFKFLIIKLIYFFSLMWFLPVIFCYILNFIVLNLINKYKIFLDLGWMEYFGGNFFIIFYNFYKKFLFLFKFKYFFILILIFIIF